MCIVHLMLPVNGSQNVTFLSITSCITSLNHKDNQFEATDNLNNDSFVHLVGKVDILAIIVEANNDNLRREQQDKAGDYMFKKKKKKKLTKTEQQEAQKRNQPKL